MRPAVVDQVRFNSVGRAPDRLALGGADVAPHQAATDLRVSWVTIGILGSVPCRGGQAIVGSPDSQARPATWCAGHVEVSGTRPPPGLAGVSRAITSLREMEWPGELLRRPYAPHWWAIA